jgi:hypothetical protein
MITTLAEQVYFKTCNNFNTAIADGEFPASGSYIDVADFERFVFVIRAGTLDSAMTCIVQQATAVNGTAKDVSGATVTVGATDDNELWVIEVETRKLDISNAYRYVTLDVTGAAGSNDYLDIVFLGINPGSAPVTQPTGTNTPVMVMG